MSGPPIPFLSIKCALTRMIFSLAEHGGDGLGCIDHCDRRIETPEQVIARVEEAMRYVDKSRITLHPDCGFSPSVQNPMDLDEAYLKLKAMCEAAEMLRAKHG